MAELSVLERAADLARRRWEFRTADKLMREHVEHIKDGCPLSGVVAQCGVEQWASEYLAKWTPLSDVPKTPAPDIGNPAAHAAPAITITVDAHGWAEITLPDGNQFRLCLPTADDITEHCDGYDRCEFEVTFYHQH